MTTRDTSKGLRGRDDPRGAGPRFLVVGGLAIVVAGLYGGMLVATEGEPLLVAPLVGALVGLAVFARPEIGLYLLFGAAVIFEQFEITGVDPLTARTHFFQNFSAFSDVPLKLSPSDVLAFMTLASWATRRIVGANAPARAGPIGWGVAAYGLAFGFGTVVGLARGGGWDGSAAIAEARGPAYVCVLYFLAANLVRTRGQVAILVWEFVLLVGVKAFQGIWNYVEVATRGPFWIEAVTAHEDVVFFDVLVALALVMVALRLRSRLLYVLIALLPVVGAAELLTQRRVAFAALAAVLVVVALMSAVDRPRTTAIVLALSAVAFGIYTVVFWDHHGPLAEPVSVVREVIDPNSIGSRDRGSNLWREIENSNIAYTVRQLPLTGVGVGQQYLFQLEPPPLTAFVFWRHITHNALLWLWLKAGPFGAFALWFLVAQVAVVCLRLYRRLDDPFLRAAASFPVLLTVAQIVFSSLDLGLTYNRTMTVLGVGLGLAAPLSVWVAAESKRDRRTASAAVNDPHPRHPKPSGPSNRVGAPVPTT